VTGEQKVMLAGSIYAHKPQASVISGCWHACRSAIYVWEFKSHAGGV